MGVECALCGECAMMCMPVRVDNHEHEEMLPATVPYHLCALKCVVQH